MRRVDEQEEAVGFGWEMRFVYVIWGVNVNISTFWMFIYILFINTGLF